MDTSTAPLQRSDLGFAQVPEGYDIYLMKTGKKLGTVRKPSVFKRSGYFIELFGHTWKNAKPGARVLQEIDAVSPKTFVATYREVQEIVLDKLNGKCKR